MRPQSTEISSTSKISVLLGGIRALAHRLPNWPAATSCLIRCAKPVREEGVEFETGAAAAIFKKTNGYPYFIQEWAKSAWDIASESPITLNDVDAASTIAVAALDSSFFRVRFDRLTPSEKRYLRAMADLGLGPHRSGDTAGKLERPVQSVAPVRNNLIKSGMIWSPYHGDTAFAVPLFDDFMQSIMPGDEWKYANRLTQNAKAGTRCIGRFRRGKC